MLTTDYDLKASDIQQLSNADALAGMFAALGYDVTARLTQTPAAMGFPEALAREVRRIERIADHEQGALQVYLIELKHVTVKLTQDLARVFKNRAGLFLLVLTTPDYERLDFVLLEPLAPLGAQTGIGAPQATLRPRILSVERRNPDRVSLRVLRRFSYTELDADYQWDKLRSAYGVAEWSEPLFNNRALFSDYYLNERLPQRGEWKEDPRPAYRALSDLMAEARQKYAAQPEEKVRAELLEPVFKILGWAWEPGKHAKDESLEPDYWLKTPAGERVPCLAYAWDRSLDGVDEKRDTNTPTENPAQTVVSILESMDADSAGWAIVTNGKTWRLYSARAHSRATNYYEIDLEETLASPDLAEAFRYFWLFFRSAAFIGIRSSTIENQKSAIENRISFLDSLLAESASYAKALGERLKENVFEEVFPYFAEGFIRHWDKPAAQLSDAELDETFHATLTFLYRLLFLLYAEARDLLPVKETRGYWEVSLSRMKQEIAAKAGNIADEAEDRLKKAYSATETALYDRLSELFAVIDKGKPDLNVPMYNGGLFVTFDGETLRSAQGDIEEAEELRAARFLAAHKIPDRFLALGLDKLARSIDEKTQSLAMIDYKSLGVRQLGSIYEGLLEFKLRVAREKMAVVQGKKGEQIVPYKEAAEKKLKVKSTGRGAARREFVIQKGEVYLENDKHERKASGSYYTPDYIVKYIVQQTVGPALEARCEALRPKLREAQKAYHAALERQKAFQKMGQKGDDPEKTAFAFRALVDELFDLRVLDPAMGSGHFLVEAVDFITDRLLAFLNAFPWNPVTATLRQTRQTILEEMQRQGVSIDPARLTDVNLLKRHVLKRCIYGVDLNPMAVELAKVSLWLDCFTLGAPLSFLDHHLKCGNSLIGAQVEKVRSEIETVAITKKRKAVAENKKEYKTVQSTALQFDMFGSMWTGAMLATDLMRQVGELSDVTAEQVRQSREEYKKAADALAPFKLILDVYTSQWFGNDPAQTLNFLRDGASMKWLKNPRTPLADLQPAAAKIAATALQAAREKRFFHWELEFPEVFFGPSQHSAQEIVLKENAGFDAVVGNPPYVLTSAKDDTKSFESQIQDRRALENSGFYQTLWGRWDIFVPFAERAVNILKRHGLNGFIISNSIEIAPYASKLRTIILSSCHLREIHYFSGFQVFEGVGVNPTVYILHKDINVSGLVVKRYHHTSTDLKNTTPEFVRQDVGENIWNSSFKEDQSKSKVATLRLGDICYICAGAQLQSDQENYRDAFTKDDLISPKRTNTHTHLYLEGKDVDRYDASDFKYVAYDSNIQKMKRPRFKELFENPKLLISLSGYAVAQIRQDYPFEEWVYCNHSIILALRWCQLENVVNRSIDKSLPSLDRGNVRKYYESTSKKYSLLYLLALINSKYVNSFTRLQLTRHKIFITEEAWRQTPIRQIDFRADEAIRLDYQNIYEPLIQNQKTTELLSFVEARLAAQPEESDVVHDLLAHLAERMIELNKQKQAEMKRFLSWLEGLLGGQRSNVTGQDLRPSTFDLESLTGKSKVKNYLGDYQKGDGELPFEELEEILFKNRNKLGVSLSDSRLMAKLREEYEKSLAALRPIKSALRWTDDLIDQIVYRLYGLTEEEIAIVEGKS